MALTYGFYNANNGDRTYDALQISRLFKGIITDGVFSSIGTALVAAPSIGMQISIGIGRAWFNNTWTENDSIMLLTVPQSEVVLNRIDTVVLEVNSDEAVRANVIKVIKGTPATTPVRIEPIHTGTLNQYVIAEISVTSGLTTITSLQIANKVGTADFPFITGVLESLDVSTLLDQYNAQFDIWFDSIKDQLTTDAAGNLQLQINEMLPIVQTGWTSDDSVWSYQSVDGPTGVISVNADKTQKIQKGYRIKYDQLQPLTAYFPFDDDANSDVGSFVSTPTNITFTPGKYGNAATFNGTTSTIVITDDEALHLGKNGKAFTVGMTIKSNSVGGSLLSIFSDALSKYSGIHILVSSSNLTIFSSKNTGITSNDFTSVSFLGNLLDGNNHDLVFSFNNNYAQIYIDRVLSAYGYLSTPVYNSSMDITIGGVKLSSGIVNLFNGQIDDLFILNDYAFDEKTIYDKGVSVVPQGPSPVVVTKNAIVMDVGRFTNGSTFITADHGTDFSLKNATISNPCYSGLKIPFGFNANENKWSHLIESTIDSAVTPPPSIRTPIGVSIVSPKGIWKAKIKGQLEGYSNAETVVGVGVVLGISPERIFNEMMATFVMNQTLAAAVPFERISDIVINEKTVLNLYVFSGQSLAGVYLRGTREVTIIKLTNGYL